MAFVFRFQQLLQICIHEENEVKNRLAKKDGQIAELNLEVKKLKDEYQAGLEKKSEDLLSGNMANLQFYPAYFARLRKSWEFHEEELERLHKQRERILEELVEKRKNRNTYEKMKEKDQLKFKKEQQKKEQKRLDEFGSRSKNQKGKRSSDGNERSRSCFT